MNRDELRQLAQKSYTYGMGVDLRTGSAENRLAIGVLDNISKVSGLITVDVKVR